eukprot:9395451-Alexandrium_andersonii.AAC.1
MSTFHFAHFATPGAPSPPPSTQTADAEDPLPPEPRVLRVYPDIQPVPEPCAAKEQRCLLLRQMTSTGMRS